LTEAYPWRETLAKLRPGQRPNSVSAVARHSVRRP
jgi:hypothetical protein